MFNISNLVSPPNNRCLPPPLHLVVVVVVAVVAAVVVVAVVAEGLIFMLLTKGNFCQKVHTVFVSFI